MERSAQVGVRHMREMRQHSGSVAETPTLDSVRVRIFPPVGQLASRGGLSGGWLSRVADEGIDHLCVGDHVSFRVGAGSDALITAASLLGRGSELPVYVGLYLLPLRHPVLVARQLASIGELAPGRLAG